MNNKNKELQGRPIVARCLAALPLNIAEIVKAFKKQGA
jgi:hypothetical protein